jgi:hypothetical protein
MILIGSSVEEEEEEKNLVLFFSFFFFSLRSPLLPLFFNEIHAPHVALSRPRTRSFLQTLCQSLALVP